MPALHLPHEPVGHLVGGELPVLLPQHQLPGEMEHQVTHFIADGGRATLAQGMVEFERLLDQIGAKSGPGLDAVPGAPPAEIPDDVESASKR
jgi:hypothetical protein